MIPIFIRVFILMLITALTPLHAGQDPLLVSGIQQRLVSEISRQPDGSVLVRTENLLIAGTAVLKTISGCVRENVALKKMVDYPGPVTLPWLYIHRVPVECPEDIGDAVNGQEKPIDDVFMAQGESRIYMGRATAVYEKKVLALPPGEMHLVSARAFSGSRVRFVGGACVYEKMQIFADPEGHTETWALPVSCQPQEPGSACVDGFAPAAWSTEGDLLECDGIVWEKTSMDSAMEFGL